MVKDSISSASSTHSHGSRLTAPSSPEGTTHQDRHSYSCKRCRRLKKKCSRTKPECVNCGKAGDLCEYVPRAPRRKKSEILRSLRREDQTSLSPPLNDRRVGQHPTNTEQYIADTLPHINKQFEVHAYQYAGKPSLPPLSSLAMYQHQQQQQQQQQQHHQQQQPFHPQHHHQPSMEELHQQYLSKVINIATDQQFSKSPMGPLCLTHDLLEQCLEQYVFEYAREYPLVSGMDYGPLMENFNRAMSSSSGLDGFELILGVTTGYLSLTGYKKIPMDLQLCEALQQRAQVMFERLPPAESLDTVSKLIQLGILSLFSVKSYSSWFLDGVITRSVLGLGINRSSSTPTDEWSNRVFWSAYNFDRFVAGSLGRSFALDDDDIDVPLPQITKGDDPDSLQTMSAMIQLRRLQGRLIKRVHTVNAGKNGDAASVIKSLRMEIEAWYNTTSLLAYTDTKLAANPATTAWYSSEYYQLLSLLYKPSFLVPSLKPDALQLLGKSTVQYLTYLYNLHMLYPLPQTWTHISRFISHCSTMIYCITHVGVDLTETKTELNLCIEILEYYRDRCNVAADTADLFRRASKRVYDSQMGADETLKDPVQFRLFLKTIGEEYLEILEAHKFDVKSDERVIAAIKR